MKQEEFETLQREAESGDSESQNLLGCCYQSGNGVAKDLDKGFFWYQKAANQGEVLALNNMGFCYKLGWGCDKDKKHAYRWFWRARNAGYPYANENMQDLDLDQKSRLEIECELFADEARCPISEIPAVLFYHHSNPLEISEVKKAARLANDEGVNLVYIRSDVTGFNLLLIFGITVFLAMSFSWIGGIFGFFFGSFFSFKVFPFSHRVTVTSQKKLIYQKYGTEKKSLLRERAWRIATIEAGFPLSQ